VRQDDRATHEVDELIRVIKIAMPGLSQRQIARLAATSETTVRRALRRIQPAGATHSVNGREPELNGAGQ
jgi:transposase